VGDVIGSPGAFWPGLVYGWRWACPACRLFGVSVVVALWLLIPAAGAARAADLSHRQAVEMARQGDYAAALPVLDELHRHHPTDLPLLYDYLAVLAWAGEDARVAALIERVDPQRAPLYVLEAAAKSLRNLNLFDRAEALYRSGIGRFPSSPTLRSGLLYTLADAGKHEEAAGLAQTLGQLYPGHVETQFAIAYAAQRRGDYVAALQCYQRILDWQPQSQRAQRLEILSLAAIGDPFRAEELAEQRAGLLSAAERHRLKADQAALVTRWGSYGSDLPAQRFAETDRALGMLDDNEQAARGDVPGGDNFVRRARIDRLVALRDRVEMGRVVEEYRSLEADQVMLPAYALQAAADAFLYQENPQQAGLLYRKVLQSEPDNFEAAQGLFFAYIEQEDFERALELAEKLRTEQVGGPDRLEAELLAALGQIFANDLVEGASRLTPMYHQAPANHDILGETGGLYAARGWPRRAEEIYRLGLALDPAYLSLRTGYAENRLDLKEFEQAGILIGALGDEYPEHKAVQRLQRLWEAHNMRELQVSVAAGWSSGSTFGSRDLSLAATLFSPPVHHRYRGFVATYLEQASFPEGDKTLQRFGAGIEYRHRHGQGTAEMTWSVSGGQKLGARLAAVWMPDDEWSIPVAIELFSRETPLRALKHGIEADAARIGVTYRRDELRRYWLQAGFMDFSDGNFRYSLLGGVEQGLIIRPHYRLDGLVEFYTSANSEDDAPYFNPRRDADLTLTLANDWLLYRHYRFSFRNRLAVSAGGYWQQDFGVDPTAALRYEHVWEYSPRFFLLYGVSLARRSYDGDGENQLGCHLELNWRF